MSLEAHQLIVKGISFMLLNSISSFSSFNNYLVNWISYLLERDQETSTSAPATSSTSSAPVTSAPSQSSPVHGAPTSADQLIGNFDEFDPRSSVTGAKNLY